MRSKNASGVITLLHCLSSGHEDYDLKFLPDSYMKKILTEYHAYVSHLSRNSGDMPPELTLKSDSLEKIRRRLLELNLIADA